MGGDNDGTGNQCVEARIEYDDGPELENDDDVPKDGDAYNRPGMGKCGGVEMPTTGQSAWLRGARAGGYTGVASDRSGHCWRE
jgi:hypothetical protein